MVLTGGVFRFDTEYQTCPLAWLDGFGLTRLGGGDDSFCWRVFVWGDEAMACVPERLAESVAERLSVGAGGGGSVGDAEA